MSDAPVPGRRGSIKWTIRSVLSDGESHSFEEIFRVAGKMISALSARRMVQKMSTYDGCDDSVRVHVGRVRALKQRIADMDDVTSFGTDGTRRHGWYRLNGQPFHRPRGSRKRQ